MRRILLVSLVLAGLAAAVPAAQAVVQPRIIGGVPADPAEWGSTVALMTDYGSQFCAGTVIQPEWVLTAGHCRIYRASAVRVVSGTMNIRSGGTTSEVVQMLRHPGYRQSVPGAPRNDLMLVRLRTPIASPPMALASRRPVNGSIARIAGWGSTSYNAATDTFGPGSPDLRTTTVRVRAAQTCIDNYGAGVFVPEDMICASLPGQDACAGDSGGPLIQGRGVDARLVGVVSWGTGCALPRYPGVYSLVPRNACWITSTTTVAAPPTAVVAAQEDGALTIEWAWNRPCDDAPSPSGFRVRVAETGQLIDVAPGLRQLTIPGLANGQPYTVAVSVLNRNGEGAPASVQGTPGPPQMIVDSAAWTGFRQARLSISVPPHEAPLRWRVEVGRGLQFQPRAWQDLPPSAVVRRLQIDVVGIRPEAIALRVEIDTAGVLAATRSIALEAPRRPALIGRARLTGEPQVGRALTCEIGRWAGTRPVTVRRSWLRDGRLVPGATARQYRVAVMDVGRALRCRVTVSGPGGVARTLTASVAAYR